MDTITSQADSDTSASESRSVETMPTLQIAVKSSEREADEIPKTGAVDTISGNVDDGKSYNDPASSLAAPPVFTGYRDKVSWWALLYKSAPDAIGMAGIKYAFNPGEVRWRRLLWILLVMASSGFLLYQIIDRSRHFASNPKSVDVSSEYVTELDFPTVAICNNNAFRASMATGTSLGNSLEQWTTSFFTPDQPFDYLAYQSNFSAYNITDAYIKWAHEATTSMFIITWNNRPLTTQNFTTRVTDWGVCFTFNDIDNGQPALTVSSAGRSYGLQLMMDVQQWEYYYGVTAIQSAGLQVAIYDRGSEPQITEQGYAVAPGTHTIFGFDVTEVTNIKEPYGQCENKTLKYYDRYGIGECRAECKADFLGERCGCKMLNLRGNYSECTVWQFLTCVVPSMYEGMTCDCPVPCKHREYQPTISSAAFPSDFWANMLGAAYNISSEHFQKNIVLLTFYIREMKLNTILQQVDYNFFSLLCDIGGSLGLWLGGSILTVFEIFDLVGHTCFLYSRKRPGRT